MYPELTLNAANLFPSQLTKLMNCEELHIWRFEEAFPCTIDSERLSSLFDKFGSDKTSHGYEKIYAKLLSNFPKKDYIQFLEIGIGTNSPGLVSSMGRSGKPGASLKALEAFDDRLRLIGADVDRKILFQSERINCFFIDQTNFETYERLCEDSSLSMFDFIVDDGLHSTLANINTIIFALKHLSTGGYLIIEDIPDASLPVWRIVVSLLKNRGLNVFVTRAQRCNVLILQKAESTKDMEM